MLVVPEPRLSWPCPVSIRVFRETHDMRRSVSSLYPRHLGPSVNGRKAARMAAQSPFPVGISDFELKIYSPENIKPIDQHS